MKTVLIFLGLFLMSVGVGWWGYLIDNGAMCFYSFLVTVLTGICVVKSFNRFYKKL